MVASSYLAYGGVMQVIRADDAGLKNAVIGAGITDSTFTGLKIKSETHYNQLGYDENVITGIEFAAKTLGSSNIKIFFTITLPLVYPGILAGFVLSFARSIGEFGATIAFVGNIPGETQTLPLALWLLIETSDNNTEIMRLGIISISLALS